MIFGIIGVVLNTLISNNYIIFLKIDFEKKKGLVLLRIYTNYNFLEKNSIKRRYRSNLLWQQAIKLTLIILGYTNLPAIYKHVAGHFYSALILIDYYKFYPIRDSKLSIMYGGLAFTLEWLFILVSIFELTS